ncbi:UNVERIFIED_CONTAM: hypothetical protein FKN15_078068 [Acipenser sinensis]
MDKEALQQQQYSNRLQISALQSKLDETRHRFPENSSDQVLKEQLEAEREALLNKEKEVEILHDQLDQFQKDLVNKSEEVLQLNMQLEIQMKQSAASIEKVQEESKQLKGDDSRYRNAALFLNGQLPTVPGMNCPTIQYEARSSCCTVSSPVEREIVDSDSFALHHSHVQSQVL